MQSSYLRDRLAIVGAFVGFVVPLICVGVKYESNAVPDTWVLFLWPSSIMTMAIFHPGASAVIAFGISVFVNAILYGGIGYLLGLTLTAITSTIRNET